VDSIVQPRHDGVHHFEGARLLDLDRALFDVVEPSAPGWSVFVARSSLVAADPSE